MRSKKVLQRNKELGLPRNHGTLWLVEDVRTLKKMRRKDKSMFYIAQKLGRTESACASYLTSLRKLGFLAGQMSMRELRALEDL